MAKHYGKYLKFLAAEYNVLYIGRSSPELFNEIADDFMSVSYVDANEEILNKLDSILIKRHIDIVIMDVSENNPITIEFYKQASAFDENILFMLLLEKEEYDRIFDIIPRVDAIVSYPLHQETYYRKLVTLLSHRYAINSINRRNIVLQQSGVNEDSSEIFFEQYQGSALFLSDDLMEVIKNLEDGNLSKQFLDNIASEIDEIADIFSKKELTSAVTPIFRDLASYLKHIELDMIEAQNLVGFSYLSNILNDVSVYLMDMFVDRVFKDVHIFEDSLKSNIDFMKNRLEGKEEHESKLEFFQ